MSPLDNPLNKRSTIFPEITTVFFLALIVFSVRYGYILAYLQTVPYADQPANDAKVYWDLGRTIYVKGWLPETILPFYQAPLYPYCIAMLHHIGIHTVEQIIRLHTLLGVFNVLLCYTIARFRLERIGAFVAALAYGLCHLPLFFESKILATTVGITFFLIFCILFLLWMNHNKTSILILSAILFSMAILCRPPFLFIFPFLLVLFVWRCRKDIKTGWHQAAIFAVVVLLGLLPVMLINGIIGGDFVPISANSGVTLYMGNNPQAEGGLAPVKGLSNDIEMQYTQSIALASQLAGFRRGGSRTAPTGDPLAGQSLKPSEASNFWIQKTIQWAWNHPLQFFVLEIKKFLWALYVTPPAVNYSFHFESVWLPILRCLQVFTWFCLAGGLAGIFLLWQKEDPFVPFLFSLIFGYLLLSLVYYASDRFLAAALPIFAILSVMTFRRIYRNSGRIKKLIYVVIIGTLVANPFFAGNRGHEIGIGWYNYGVRAEREGNTDLAITFYERSLEFLPDFPSALLNLGVLHAKHNELKRSNQLFRRVLEIEPDNPIALKNLRINLRRMGTDGKN